MQGLVYIIVLNWNNWKDTLNCLESIFQSSYTNYKLLIIDNGSTDSSGEKIKDWAKENGKDIEIIQTGGNLGFTGGNNAGLKHIYQKKDFNYIWILNNDTVVDKDALSSLVSCLESDPSAGMAGSKLLYYDKPTTIQNVGGCKIVPWLGNSFVIANNSPDDGNWDKPFEPDYINGASLLVKREVLEKIGLFDENYFLYWEDADLGVRARRAGYKLLYCPESRVLHKEGGTGGRLNPLTDYYWVRNGLYFTRKFYPWFLPSVFAAYVFKYAVLRTRRGQSSNFKAFFKGITDFSKEVFGKKEKWF